MELFARLAALSPALFLLALFVLFFLAREVGYALGRRHMADPEAAHEGGGASWWPACWRCWPSYWR